LSPYKFSMENQKPEFALKDRSPISVATELHSYFRDLESYYKIAQGQTLGLLEATHDEAKKQELKLKLQEINEKVNFFHVINNAISIVDTVLHTKEMIAEFNPAPEDRV
jgi:hypothetical protein